MQGLWLRLTPARGTSCLVGGLAVFLLTSPMPSAAPDPANAVKPQIEISGHRSEVRSLRYLRRDGRNIISNSFDSLVVWDAETGREIRRLIDGSTVFPFAVSPDGSRLFTVNRSGARIVDVDSGEIIVRFDPAHTEQLFWPVWSPDAQRVATLSAGAINLWNPLTAELVRKLDTGFRRSPRVAWSPDGLHIAALGSDGTFLVFNASEGESVFRAEAHPVSGIHNLEWAPSGDFIATGGADGLVKLWSTDTWTLLHTLQGFPTITIGRTPPDGGDPVLQGLPISALAFSPDSTLVASAADALSIWNVESGHEARRWVPTPEDNSFVPHYGTITNLKFDPTGSFLASAGVDASAKIWNVDDGTQIANIDTFHGAVEALDWSPDGARLAMAGTDGASVVWNVMAHREEVRFEGHRRGTVLSLDFAPRVPRIVTSGRDGTVKVWYTRTGGLMFDLPPLNEDAGPRTPVARPARQVWYSPWANRVMTLSDPPSGSILEARIVSAEVRPAIRLGSQVTAAAWSPDARRVAVAGYGFYIADFENLASEPIILGLDGAGGDMRIKHVAWSRDGERVLTSSGSGAAIWDWKTGRRVFAVQPESGAAYAEESADGSLLLTIDGQFRAPRAQIWSTESRVEVATFGPATRIESAQFLDDGKRVITTSSRVPVARIWDSSTGQELLSLAGHGGGVVGVSSSPDGTLVATAGRDRTVRIWDAATGVKLAVLGPRPGSLFGVKFSPDGRQIAAYGVGGAALWDLPAAF